MENILVYLIIHVFANINIHFLFNVEAQGSQNTKENQELHVPT